MSDYTNYAQFNVMTITGRVAALKLLNGQYGESLAVTMISTMETDKEEVNITFTNKNGLMTMYKNGNLTVGRQLTVTGHMTKVEQLYTDKEGVMRPLKRARIALKQVQVLDGGLGPAPKKEVMPSTVGQVIASTPVDGQPKVDPTPSTEEIPF